MTLAFTASGNSIALTRTTPSRLPFGKASIETVPFEDWVVERPPAATAAVARILQAVGDGDVGSDGLPLIRIEGAGATLHPAFVSALTDTEAEAIGLPPATRLALDLRSSGLIHKDGFRIDTRWLRAGGVVATANVKNDRLRYGGNDWRIPEPLYSTLAHVAQINAATGEAARHVALADLKRAIGEDGAARIATDGVIDRLRLSYASGFSLALRTSAAGFDFDPVLFGRERLDAADEGASPDEESDSLLPPALARGFIRRFRSGDGARATYLLDDGSILYVDPQLSRVLKEVRRAQGGSAEQRRAFAAAPQRHIADALRAHGEEPGDAARLFIETQQFSERVAGIDVWRKPVLPWVKPKANSWLPESFGLRIGGGEDARTVVIPPERLEEAHAAASEAVREERATFAFDAETIPATQATVDALASLSELSRAATVSGGQADEPPAALRQRYFLQVRDNLEDVAYAPLVARQISAAAPDVDPPLALRSPPKPHQVTGFRWLVKCWQAGTPGALLADDMGLGKTYQALAFLAWARQQEPHPRPVLIVAPTGLLANWRAEIDRHLEPDTLGRIVGAYGRELADQRDGRGRGRDIDSGESALDPAAWAHAGIVLTTYETMRDYHLSFARQPFAAILYDEAQKLKNPASQITRAAKTLNSRFSLAMTGTPVENRLQDLWSIFDVVHPGLLGSSKAFEQSYPVDGDRLQALHDRLTLPHDGMPPILLRRMKEDCLDSLPRKIVRPIPTVMPPRQAVAYDRVVHKALAVKGTGQRGRMLEVLAQLRGVSLHPTSPDEAGGDLNYWSDSARLQTLFALLQTIAAAGEKVLIFCESLAMQALLAAEIRRRFNLSHTVERIHGGVSGNARQAAVDMFQRRAAGFDAMILSPKAGGVGLTLTAANHVVHLSRWWNPAVEDQATDRAFRIGQTRNVTVYLPQAIHPEPALRNTSFDLKLHALMERKRTLSRGLFASGEDDSDADALFDAVVTDVAPEPMRASATMPEVPIVIPERPRSKLSLRRPLAARADAEPPSAISAQSAQTEDRGIAAKPNAEATARTQSAPSWPRRVVYVPEQQRDLSIFRKPLADDPAQEIHIVDPYAAAGMRARSGVVEFVAMLTEGAPRPTRVSLTTYDGESIERPVETSALQYQQMQERWRRQFGADTPLTHRQRSKWQAADLHDREVRVVTRSGRTLLWDLGRGIDGVMGTRFGCRVNLTEL
jgi:hypothetical protein